MKLVLWCNPHNPSGRMWTEEELKRVAEIVEKHNLWLISDEIHCDIIRNGRKHIPMGKVMPAYDKLITCMSASKTFNMAGLMFSDIIIRDAQLRKIFCKRDKIVGFVNPLSVAAHQAAYEKCDEWLAEFKTYLDEKLYVCKGISGGASACGGVLCSRSNLSCLGESEGLPAGCCGSARILCK